MLTLPSEFTSIIVAFAPLFFNGVWRSAQILLIGAILAPGKRTVTSALRVMGLSDERRFQIYHRVLNRAVWSSRQASFILLRMLVTAFAPTGRSCLSLMTPSSGAGAPGVPPAAFIAMPCVPRIRILSKPAGCAGSA